MVGHIQACQQSVNGGLTFSSVICFKHCSVFRTQNLEWFIQPQQQVTISLKNCKWHNTVYIRKVKGTTAKGLNKGHYHRATLWILSSLKIKHFTVYISWVILAKLMSIEWTTWDLLDEGTDQ